MVNVSRTVMMQFFTAHGAGVVDRQIPAEQGTAATLGTFAFHPLALRAWWAFRLAVVWVGHGEPLGFVGNKVGVTNVIAAGCRSKFQKMRRKLWALRLLI